MEDDSRRDLLWKTLATMGAVAAAAQVTQTQATTSRTVPQPDPQHAPDAVARELQSLVDTAVESIRNSGAASDRATPPAPSVPVTGELSRRDQQRWSEIQERARPYLEVDGGTDVGARFRFSPRDEDVAFRMQHVELLLDQMAALLERGLATRASWNDMQATAFNVRLQLEHYFALDRIHEEEIAAGYYDQMPRRAELDAAADQFTKVGLEAHIRALESMTTTLYGSDSNNKSNAYAGLLAFLSHLADYSAQAEGEFVSYTAGDGTRGASHTLANTAATWLNNQSLMVQQAWLWAQITALRGGVPTADQKMRSSSVRSVWEAKNAGFQLRRTEVGRQMADAKADAYTAPGGALNYPAQMARLEARFNRDFRDALARLKPASDGIRALYGYAEPVPARVAALLAGNAPTTEDYDECLNWVRNAISFLVRFSQTEQRYSLSLSLRSRLGDARYLEGRAQPEWGRWTLSVPRALFPDQFYVRLRGVTVYTSGPRSEGMWTSTLRPPVSSFIEHLASSGPVQSTLDQSNIPSAIGGRSSYREHPRVPEIIGGSAFYNVSPFGDWQIKLLSQSSNGTSISQVDDVVLELHLAVKMRT